MKGHIELFLDGAWRTAATFTLKNAEDVRIALEAARPVTRL